MVSVYSVRILLLLSCASATNIIGYDGKEVHHRPSEQSGIQSLKDSIPHDRSLTHLHKIKPILKRMVTRLADNARGALKFEKVEKLEVDMNRPPSVEKSVTESFPQGRNLIHSMLDVKRAVKTKGALPTKDLLPFLPTKNLLHGTPMDDISKFRAELCAQMKDEHGDDFESMEDCTKFMKKACRPGKDNRMDGDKNERTTGAGHCKKFFPPDGEAKSDAEQGDAEQGAKDNSADVDSSPAPAPAPEDAPHELEKASSKTTARNLAEDKFHADGGHQMYEEVPLQEQGFGGELVTHDDQASMIKDWQREFGPKIKGEHDLYKICAQYRNNEWCRMHGYYSDASTSKSSMVLILLSAAVALVESI